MTLRPCFTPNKALSSMRLVVYSPYFHPRLGGVETVVQVLATEWVSMGHQVTVITDTPNPKPDVFSFCVLRRPGFLATVAAYRAADVVIFANISLWGLLPLLFCGSRRPSWVVTHQIWYENPGHPVKLLDRIKKALAHYASANISCSQAVDRFLGLNGYVIPNPYDQQLFRLLPEVLRNRDLVFLGRLVSDKGCDLLLNALAHLREQGVTPSLSIIGSGPAQFELEDQVLKLHLDSQVRFCGAQSGEALVSLLNEHRIMVVPSRWNEPFGVVALEGIACGCTVIGSSGGGLPEAIGACGITFPNDDYRALAGVINQVLRGPHNNLSEPVATEKHLALHDSSQIARRYLQVFQQCAQKT
ncbi:glycosyltransferase family 4 protein [Prosthecobacter vanneervenii]|uniref:Glycosyltransferase involved in cell wall biosynthesis n=1 Tax=Prosthecobacter vanneervenii TaxID=48466 RepID=A0A7W8DIF1_9BACT|nr:glycosyltransferase family 4 protein [Prosthecobacter vanneervenii]MBB5030963.1 glycosyltransferase involved in cell wall biosynthesis [Prosthecobacter vanneervenii]